MMKAADLKSKSAPDRKIIPVILWEQNAFAVRMHSRSFVIVPHRVLNRSRNEPARP
jgi:hypothetical protein